MGNCCSYASQYEWKFEIGRTYVFLQGLLKHLGNIPALRISSSETLGPADELAVVNALLPEYRNTSILHALN